jgi:hypothetical protein
MGEVHGKNTLITTKIMRKACESMPLIILCNHQQKDVMVISIPHSASCEATARPGMMILLLSLTLEQKQKPP